MSYFLKKLLFSCHRSAPIEDDWKGEVHLVKVVSVYDGDTLTVSLIRNGKFIKQKVRMNGYDTPEIKPPLSKPEREKEIEKAKKAREDFISQHQEYMWLFCDGRDKYGRILGRLHRVSSCIC
jgi:endonuclease YncB( thermonuclease family)